MPRSLGSSFPGPSRQRGEPTETATACRCLLSGRETADAASKGHSPPPRTGRLGRWRRSSVGVVSPGRGELLDVAALAVIGLDSARGNLRGLAVEPLDVPG